MVVNMVLQTMHSLSPMVINFFSMYWIRWRNHTMQIVGVVMALVCSHKVCRIFLKMPAIQYQSMSSHLKGTRCQYWKSCLNSHASFRIMGVKWQVSDKIIDSPDPISFTEWKRIFADASSVHFSGATRVNLKWELPDDPQYSAYALLGQRYCPLSYYSVQYF